MNRKQFSRRDFLRIAGVTGLGILAASCAPAATPEQEPPATAEEPTTEAPSEAQKMRVSIVDVDIESWYDVYESFETQFAEHHPDIELNYRKIPYTGLTESILTMFASGEHFDCIYGNPQELGLLIENGVVIPLDDFLNSDPEIDYAEVYEWAKLMMDGKVYGLPWFVTAEILHYNKTLVQELGIDDPNELDKAGKWDLDAALAFGQQCTHEDDELGGHVYGLDVSNMRQCAPYYQPLAWGEGADVWKQDFSECIIDEPKHTELWQYLQQFYLGKMTPMPGETVLGDQTPGFSNGYAAMYFSNTYYTRVYVADGTADKFDIGMVAPPKGSVGQIGGAGGQAYWMCKEPEYPEAAWIWYKDRAISDYGNRLWATLGSGRVPLLSSGEPAPEYDWEDVEVYKKLASTARRAVVTPVDAQFDELFFAAYDEMILEARPIGDILAQLADQATALIQGA